MKQSTWNDLTMVLAQHAKKYPQMRPADAVKLIFQNEFGGGHMVADPEKAFAALCEELSGVKYCPSLPLLEEIGGGMVRIMLAGADQDVLLPEELNRDFVRSANSVHGDMERFQYKLGILRQLTGEGLFAFDSTELEDYLKDYISNGCPAVSHSQEYRNTYHPFYRVVVRKLSLIVMLEEIRTRCRGQKRVLVAIDGRCASGKSTLAALLHEQYGWEVIHMDDFFLRPEQRTKERYETPGENIDHERFLEEVLLPLHEGKNPQFCPYDCHKQILMEPVCVKDSQVIIIEGSYSCHPLLWPYYDLSVFLTIGRQKQMERILQRNGPEAAEIFLNRWIPLEEKYFSAYCLEERCGYLLERG